MSHNSAAQLRQLYLDFFKSNGHTIVKSSSLVPANDPTLMFTAAGMVQFKDVFVGAEKRPYKRATTCQKCLRVSGKHNDLEEVGRTARHHTFFEMLGNFSFGDYFKEEAITFAWELVTRQLGLDKSRIWITVFGGADGVPADDEARVLWQKISGLPASRIVAKGMKDNFWAAGDVGPCGPCTEIHFDQGGPGEPTEADFDSGRVMEIWNNVFMQFERHPDGHLSPLPAPSVDTGMGLERVTALVQGQSSNYHSDLFLPLLDAIAAAAGKPYRRSDSEDDMSMRVIADHARTTAFLVADGIQPSNEGRGYVMRRIMRRAIRHGRRLGFNDVFLHNICDVVVREMGPAYPELREARSLIDKVAQVEEEGFRRTLDTGLRILGDEIEAVKKAGKKTVPGDVVFKLYDTYGFPKDLTEVIASEKGLSLDETGFEANMEAQKERSRGGEVGSAAVSAIYKRLAQKLPPTEFDGYTHEDEPLEARQGAWRRRQSGSSEYLERQCRVAALIVGEQEVDRASRGAVEVVLEPTPLYGESGGQIGDKGVIVTDAGLLIEVTDTQKPVDTLSVARGRLHSGEVRVGDTVWAGYNPILRKQTRAHHSATHLLHGALRQVLGEHVKQAGSFVDSNHLRFDFAHFAALTFDEQHAIEADVNERIRRDEAVSTEVMSFDQAKAKGAIALFGEKYGDTVRVITMGGSIEFCGGTHARRTADLLMLLITSEQAVQSGVRRIEAEVGLAARQTTKRLHQRLTSVAALLQGQESDPAGADNEALPVLQGITRAVRQYAALRSEAAGQKGPAFDASASKITVPPLPEGFGIREASGIRDAWQGLVQMVNARPADAPAIAERFGKGAGGDLLRGFAALLAANRELERLVDESRRAQLSGRAGDLMSKVHEVAGVRVLATRVDGADAGSLRQLADDLRPKLGSGVICLGAESEGKAALLVAVTADLTKRLAAGKLIKDLAPLIGGRGGGKPELAQAGGTDAAGLDAAFKKLDELLRQG